MDALQFLRAEHQRIHELFDQARHTGSSIEARGYYEDIKSELRLHVAVKEAVFYPALSGYPELQRFIDDMYESHSLLTEAERDLDQTFEPELFLDKFQDFSVDVRIAMNQEEFELFPKVRNLLHDIRLAQLGMLLADTRQRFEDQDLQRAA
jgi:hypothetical protein